MQNTLLFKTVSPRIAQIKSRLEKTLQDVDSLDVLYRRRKHSLDLKVADLEEYLKIEVNLICELDYRIIE
jgi:hypothetical protein